MLQRRSNSSFPQVRSNLQKMSPLRYENLSCRERWKHIYAIIHIFVLFKLLIKSSSHSGNISPERRCGVSLEGKREGVHLGWTLIFHVMAQTSYLETSLQNNYKCISLPYVCNFVFSFIFLTGVCSGIICSPCCQSLCEQQLLSLLSNYKHIGDLQKKGYKCK